MSSSTVEVCHIIGSVAGVSNDGGVGLVRTKPNRHSLDGREFNLEACLERHADIDGSLGCGLLRASAVEQSREIDFAVIVGKRDGTRTGSSSGRTKVTILVNGGSLTQGNGLDRGSGTG